MSATERLARLVYRLCTRLPRVDGVAQSAFALRVRRALRQSVLVRESARYALAGLLGASGVRRYHLADSGKAVLLRHPTDAWTFEEVFRARAYDPPREVVQALAVLGCPPRIVDLGANVGLFARWAADR